ncbi:MAG: hypothetical protein RL026_1369 [Pseudomonadota bacterium]|jgi:magnesium and cobalt transporter
MNGDGKPGGKTGASKWLRRLQALAGPRDRAELRDVLREARRQDLLDAEALGMLEGVLQVADLQARDIMVPRNQMVCVRRDDPPQKVLSIVTDSGHSRYPVMDADSEDVVGLLLAKDLLRNALTPGKPFDLAQLIRPAVFVPETQRVNVLLKDLRQRRNHLALVVDEYGGVAGLVTIEDVIEQIVGDIDDEYDVAPEDDIRPEPDGQFSVRGATRIGDFNDHFGSRLPDDEVDTVAGLVSQQLGRLPRRGEVAVIDGFEFRVMRADRRRVETLRVTPPPSQPATGTGESDAADGG